MNHIKTFKTYNRVHYKGRLESDLEMERVNKFHQCMFLFWSFRRLHKLHCIQNMIPMMNRLKYLYRLKL